MPDAPLAEQIIAGLPEAIIAIDDQQKIIKVNPAAESFLGTSAKHLLGESIESQIRFADGRLEKALTDTEANLAARRMEISVRGQREELVDFSLQMIPTAPETRILSISRLPGDGPAHTRSESAQSDFAVRAPDILGHEIKNPLAAIKGAAQLLDRAIDADQKSLTKMIKMEVERIADLLDRMQSLSTTQPAKLESINVHTLIDRARQSVETAAERDIKIGDRFDPSLPDALVDPDAMLQILTNLLSNAVDATQKTQNADIQVITRYSFGASFSAQNSNEAVRLPIEIIVQDNGPGVTSELENEIFSPFVSTKNEGQGLGLALVRKLAGDMNGRIRYESVGDANLTRFILSLPLATRVKYDG